MFGFFFLISNFFSDLKTTKSGLLNETVAFVLVSESIMSLIFLEQIHTAMQHNLPIKVWWGSFLKIISFPC